MATINGITTTTTASANPTTKNTSNLGKDEFLKLLITQMRYQDPMNPMEDKEFISQMAQFSSLEQMQNLNASMATTQAAAMIGKTITWDDEKGDLQTGKVTSVKVVSGQPKVMIGDAEVALEKILSIQ